MLLRSDIRPNNNSNNISYFKSPFLCLYLSFFVHCVILSIDLWTMQGNVHSTADFCSRIVETKRNQSRNGTKLPQRWTMDIEQQVNDFFIWWMRAAVKSRTERQMTITRINLFRIHRHLQGGSSQHHKAGRRAFIVLVSCSRTFYPSTFNHNESMNQWTRKKRFKCPTRADYGHLKAKSTQPTVHRVTIFLLTFLPSLFRHWTVMDCTTGRRIVTRSWMTVD